MFQQNINNRPVSTDVFERRSAESERVAWGRDVDRRYLGVIRDIGRISIATVETDGKTLSSDITDAVQVGP